MRLSYDPICRSCRLIFCITLILLWSNPTRWCPTPQARGDTTADITAQQLSAAADQLDRLLQDLHDADKAISTDTFEVRPIVVKLNADPQRLLDWVKTQTTWAPYHGVLRGPIGVLMDRTGNSLDRSILLAEMLRYTGATYRLAHVKLSNELSEKALTALAKKNDSAAKPPDADSQEKEIQDFAASNHLDPAQFRRDIDKFTLPFQQMGETVGQSVSEQVPAVRAAVTAPASPQPADHDRLLQAISDHWWIQLRDGEKWVDLDPMADQVGPLVPQSTVDPDRGSGIFPLDPAQFHQVHVRVISEQWKDGKLKQTVVFEKPMNTSDIVGKSISLSNIPVDWPGDFNLLADSDPMAHLRSVVLAQHEWVPVLMIGTDQFTQSGFFDTGEIDPKPKLDSLGKAGGSVANSANSVIQSFGEDKPAAPTGDLTAEWVEFEMADPQAPVRIERRKIFDLVGPEARANSTAAEPQINDKVRLIRGVAMLESGKFLALGCRLSSEFIQHQAIANTTANRQAMLKLLRGGASDMKDAMDQFNKLNLFPSPLYEWQVARFAWSAHPDDLFIGQTNVVGDWQQPALDDNGQLICREILDIIANPLEVRPGPDIDPFAIRLEQGVVDTNVESAIMDRQPQSPLISTAALFSRAAAQNIKWTTIRPGADPSVWNDVKIPKDIRAGIDRDLAAGYVVVVPQKGIDVSGRTAYTWWHIDPSTGETLGMTDQGGAVMGEYALMLAGVLGGVTFVTAFVGCGGASGTASKGKMIGCAVCAAAAAALVVFAILAAPGAGATGAIKAIGAAISTQAGIGGAAAVGAVCSILGAS